MRLIVLSHTLLSRLKGSQAARQSYSVSISTAFSPKCSPHLPLHLPLLRASRRSIRSLRHLNRPILLPLEPLSAHNARDIPPIDPARLRSNDRSPPPLRVVWRSPPAFPLRREAVEGVVRRDPDLRCFASVRTMESDRSRNVSESCDVEMARLDQFRNSVRTRCAEGRFLRWCGLGKERETIVRVELRLVLFFGGRVREPRRSQG